MVDFLLPYVRGEDVPACFLGYQGEGGGGQGKCRNNDLTLCLRTQKQIV